MSLSDIGLIVENKILESATSNLLFVSNNKIYSPINKFYKGTTFKFFEKKVGKIIKKNIYIKSLSIYDEIILIGSGKGVVSVNIIEKPFWRRKSSKMYRYLSKIYSDAVTNCPRYNGWSILSIILKIFYSFRFFVKCLRSIIMININPYSTLAEFVSPIFMQSFCNYYDWFNNFRNPIRYYS